MGRQASWQKPVHTFGLIGGVRIPGGRPNGGHGFGRAMARHGGVCWCVAERRIRFMSLHSAIRVFLPVVA